MESYKWLRLDESVVGCGCLGWRCVGPSFSSRRSSKTDRFVVCECEKCGNRVVKVLNNALHGRHGKCAMCVPHRSGRKRGTKNRHHKAKQSPLAYSSWKCMRLRCTKPSHGKFHLYGGAGVKICGRWRASFDNFLSDMGERPSGYHIDRRNDSEQTRHYSCGHCEECKENGWEAHCKWVSPKENARNLRTVRPLTIKGVTRCAGEWAEQPGANCLSTIYSRLFRGFSPEAAVFERSFKKRRT